MSDIMDQSVSYGEQFADVYDDLFPVDGMPVGADQRIIEMVGAGPSPRILEFGVGNGRYLVPLAEAGARCTGIDTSPAMLERARQSAARSGVSLALEQADCRDAHARFSDMDGVICVGATLGMFTERDQQAILHSAANCLRPGGGLIIETHNRHAVDRLHRERTSPQLTFPRRQGAPIVATSFFDTVSGQWWLHHEWVDDVTEMVATAKEFSFPRTAKEITLLAQRCGFVQQCVVSGWGGQVFREDSLPMIICLRREGACEHEAS